MSDQSPYEKLGLTEDASFDEIQEAKGRLIQEHGGDQKLVESIEAAYDAILMDRLKMRQQGKIPVPERIRFAERLAQAPASVNQAAVNRTPEWLQGLFDTPNKSDIIRSSAVFVVLGGLIAYPGFQESSLSLAIAFAVGFTVFFVNRKERRLGRAMLLTLVGLFVGIGLGSLLASWLPTPIPYILLTPDKVATLVTFLVMWLIASFLR
ncbi:MAG TPA: CPP1-like family protein [Candidatus Obscuribacterales bacterium]